VKRAVAFVLIVTGIFVAVALFTFPVRYGIDGGYFRPLGDCGVPIRETFSPAHHEIVFGLRSGPPLNVLIRGDANSASCHARSVRRVWLGAGVGIVLVAAGIALLVSRDRGKSAPPSTRPRVGADV
jgi:hypothetical protein